MGQVTDSQAPINIGIIAQGFCRIDSLTATPNPFTPGVVVSCYLNTTNTGAADVLWADWYVDGVKKFAPTSTNSIAAGATWNTVYPIQNVISQTTVMVNVGHMVGTTRAGPDSTRTITLSPIVITQGHANLVNVVVNPATVEPGGSTTISYSVTNTGGTDTLWGELYDAPSPGGNPVANTSWGPVQVVPGTPYTPEPILITNILTPIVNWELRVGHEE